MLFLIKTVAALASLCALSQAQNQYAPAMECLRADYYKPAIVPYDCYNAWYNFDTWGSAIAYNMNLHQMNCRTCAVRLYTQNGGNVQVDRSVVNTAIATLNQQCRGASGNIIVPHGSRQPGLGNSLFVSVMYGDNINCGKA